jgi:hypothetical protein
MNFHDVLTTATELVPKVLNAKKGHPIKTTIEVVAVVCEVVEGTAVLLWQNKGKTLSGTEKAELACQIALIVLDALYNREDPLVSTEVYNIAKLILTDVAALLPMIDGVVAITKLAPQIQQMAGQKQAGSSSSCRCF